jgi:hypothetical protein
VQQKSIAVEVGCSSAPSSGSDCHASSEQLGADRPRYGSTHGTDTWDVDSSLKVGSQHECDVIPDRPQTLLCWTGKMKGSSGRDCASGRIILRQIL